MGFRLIFKSRDSAGVLDFRQALGFLQRRLWSRTQGAGVPSDELPLLYRAAILYLALPVGVWLIGWFEWWVWLPLVALCGAALLPALRGDWRLRRGDVSPAAVAVVAVAGVLVMATAAGGFFGDNPDWLARRSAMLDLGRYAWPAFLPETLGMYAAGDYPDPLLRYYLGWHMVPSLAGKLLGPAALNWAVPLWTWAGLALIMLMFARGRRGWAAALAALIFALFSGMDIVRVFMAEGWGFFDVRFDLTDFPGVMIEPNIHIEDHGRVFTAQYSANLTGLMWVPHHFIGAGLCAALALRLQGCGRFLAAFGILLAATAFWSAFAAFGMLPLIGAMAWRSGIRPFLTWQNLLAAPALAAVVALYFASGRTDFGGHWLWEGMSWPDAAAGLAGFWLTEFLALAIALLALRPWLRREPMFIAAVFALFAFPLYVNDAYGNIALRGAMPALMALCFYCAEAVVPSGARGAAERVRAGPLARIGVACVLALLAVGAATPLFNLIRGLNYFERVRYERLELTTLVDLPWYWQDQRVAHEPPGALLALLDDDPAPSREKGQLVASGGYDAFLERDRIVLVGGAREKGCEFDYSDRLFIVAAAADGSVVQFMKPKNARARLFGDECVVSAPLPARGASGFAVGDRREDGSVVGWTARSLDIGAAVASLTAGNPAARSGFDIYIRNGLLAYFKGECAAEDVRAPFFLHIVPADAADLDYGWERRGFNNRDFAFDDYGFRSEDGGFCVAVRALPDYELSEMRTGQFGEGVKVWSETIAPEGWLAAHGFDLGAAHKALTSGDPAVRSEFDIYMRDGSLVYAKRDCGAGDVGARFFLHIVPADAADLPPAREPHGFNGMDFDFGDYGHRAADGGICVAVRDLPDYEIAEIKTGQFDGGGKIWAETIVLAR